MSVYEHSVEEIWNSKFLKELRRDLVAGKRVQACGYCYRQEKAGITSMGTTATRTWRNDITNSGRTLQDVTQHLKAEGFSVSAIESLDLDMGNLCNLKCRMCNSSYSSGIASDPVHSKWAPPGVVAVRWQGDRAVIAPRFVLGVAYEGFSYPQQNGGMLQSRLSGTAKLRAVIRGLQVAGIAVRLIDQEGSAAPIIIRVNEQIVHEGPIPDTGLRETFLVPSLSGATNLGVTVTSSRPIICEEIALVRQRGAKNTVAFSRLSDGSQWYQNRDFLLRELLARPEHLRMLRLIGGEPLLIKEIRELLLHLIEVGAAPQITLAITTNGTQGGQPWFDILSKFKAAWLAFSLDGYGEVNDYIRFPSKWSEIDGNIREFIASGTCQPRVNMTVQAYNILSIVDLATYCDSVGIELRYHLLQHPNYLSVGVLPDAARAIAVERLRNHPPLKPATSAMLKELAGVIEAVQPCGEQAVDQFGRFTAELDASRGQVLAKSIPELASLLRPNRVPEAEVGEAPPREGRRIFGRVARALCGRS